jgi:1-acyl-sn-glycerol-3-phosphate acyltransferase
VGWEGSTGELPGAIHSANGSPAKARSTNTGSSNGNGADGQGPNDHGPNGHIATGSGPGVTRVGPVHDGGAQANGASSGEAGDDWRGRLSETLRFARRQVTGEGQVDEFGFDPEFNTRLLMPLARLLYQQWFRVEMRGLEHVPSTGGALLVANHSGVLPFDAIMLQTGLHDEHPQHRNLRLLGADLVYELPGLAYLARRAGHTRACPANADRLLHDGELVGVFPEGFKGIGKPFSDRYQLRRFGRGGFAVTALRARVPIVPCAIVGAEEIYPMVGNARALARLLGLPYFPITPLFPWFGPLGAVPLPSKWIIDFGPPVETSGYREGAWRDPAVIAELTGAVSGSIQATLDDLIVERGPAFG